MKSISPTNFIIILIELTHLKMLANMNYIFFFSLANGITKRLRKKKINITANHFALNILYFNLIKSGYQEESEKKIPLHS